MPAFDDPIGQAQSISDLVWCGGTLHPIVRQIRMPIRFTDGDPTGVREKGLESFSAIIERINVKLDTSPWWYGDDWSIVDMYFSWCCSIAQSVGFPVSDFPAVKSHTDRVSEMDCFVRAVAREQSAIERDQIVFPPPP